MAQDLPSFAASRCAELVATRGLTLGATLTAVASTGSTMDDALLAARAGAPHGAVYLAETQTRGRGRRGRTWTSVPGAGLTFSLVLRPRLAPSVAPTLALAAGLAVREVVAARGLAAARVKWPNDVLVGRRKVAGVLVEAQVQGAALAAAIVGIGLNVTLRELPADLGARATSLALEGAAPLDRETLFVDLLGALQTRLEALERDGIGSVVAELREHDALRGAALRVGTLTGIGAGLDASGALLVSDAAGTTHAVVAGTVELL